MQVIRSFRIRTCAGAPMMWLNQLVSLTTIVVIILVVLSTIQQARAIGLSSNDGALLPSKGDVYIVRFRDPSAVATYGSSASDRSSRNRARYAAARNYSDHLRARHDQFLQQRLQPGSYQKLYSLTNVINGAIISLSDLNLVSLLLQQPNIVSVEKDVQMKSQTTYSYNFMKLPSTLWSKSGGQSNAGEGIIIGVIDSGVDPTHPSFSSNVTPRYGPIPTTFNGTCVATPNFPLGSCNQKLIGAQYFINGAMGAGIFNASFDFASPLDGDGHGCHVTSIAGGNNGVQLAFQSTNSITNFSAYMTGQTISGAAPRARLSIYKTMYREGGTLSDVLAAIEQAVIDGVHVISMSICPAAPPGGVTHISALDVAMLAAVQANVVVVQAAGNFGPSAGTVASFSPWIITVGSASTDRTFRASITLGNNNTLLAFGITGPTGGLAPLIYSGDVISNSTAASPTTCQDPTVLNASLIGGRMLMCDYTSDFDVGFATLSMVGKTAAALNASGFLLLQTESFTTSSFFNPPLFPIPGAFILSLASAQNVMQYYNSATSRDVASGMFIKTTAVASIGYPLTGPMQFGSKAPIVPNYSGRGPAVGNSNLGLASDVLKPDLIAPGDQIFAAWTPLGIDEPSYTGQQFAILSGTSMATPHTAGVVALLRQLHPNWSPAAIHSALVTSASTLDNKNTTISAEYPFNAPYTPMGTGTPFDFGGGEINPAGANDPGLIFDARFQDYVNFLCSLAPWTTASQVHSATGGTCNITSGTKPSDLNGPSITIASLTTSRAVTRKATSVGSTVETYTAKVTAPAGVSVTVSPSSFTIQPNQTLIFIANMKVTKATRKFGFGMIQWNGNAGHVVQMPLAIFPQSL